MSKSYKPIEGRLPEPARFGLINSETLVVDSTSIEHWENGISVESVACNTNVRILEVCNTTHSVSAVEKGSTDNNYTPFVVQTEYECSTFGFKSNDYIKKAKDAMDVCQNKAVEAEFWAGALAKLDENTGEDINQNRYLASPDAVDVTPTAGTAVKPAYGLALLEEALADSGCGAKGIIHATRGTASTLLLDKEDDFLATNLGTRVVAGSGYTGSGPTGAAPAGSKVWMYATGPVSVFLGPIDTTPENLNEAINSSINNVVVTAERFAAATWDGCSHFAVLVDLSLDYA